MNRRALIDLSLEELEALELAALHSARNMGKAEAMYHPDWGWVMIDGEVTEIGKEFFKWAYGEKHD